MAKSDPRPCTQGGDVHGPETIANQRDDQVGDEVITRVDKVCQDCSTVLRGNVETGRRKPGRHELR